MAISFMQRAKNKNTQLNNNTIIGFANRIYLVEYSEYQSQISLNVK